VLNCSVGQISAVKILDELILPLVIVAVSRYLSIFIAALVLPFSFSLSLAGGYHSLWFIDFPNKTQAAQANLISWLFVTTVLAAYFGFVVFRSLHFSHEQLHPKHAQKLHSSNMEFLIINQEEAFHQIVSWLVIDLLIFTFLFFDFLNGGLGAAALGYFLGISGALLTLCYVVFDRARKLNA